MKKIIYTLIGCATLLSSSTVFAGNPDRQGEAGAYELLFNPWARSAGFNNLTTANVSGVEAMFLNPAGLGRINNLEFSASHTRYFVGTGISFSAVGFGKHIGDNGVFGLSIMNVDFGRIPVTTTNQPEGTGNTFRPIFLNIGASYAHVFSERISVGVTARAITESISNAVSTGFAVDAGVQYTSNNIHFGISLKNVGTKMIFRGDGLSYVSTEPLQSGYALQVDRRAAGYDLPSQLNIGAAYDIVKDSTVSPHRFTVAANYCGNTFTHDQIGAGVEYGYTSTFGVFMARVGYRIESGQFSKETRTNAETGLTAGVSFEVPLSKENADRKLAIDYAYRTSNPWGGTHMIGVKLAL